MYLSLAGFLAAVFTAKFIGVEMMGVIQAAFLGLMIMIHLQPMLATFSQMNYVSGINNLFDSSKMASASMLPNRLTALQYAALFTYNFNYTFILLVLPIIVGLILFIVSKI
jgi:beta-lactamase regulating signal transducer with metallopeptidase domain